MLGKQRMPCICLLMLGLISTTRGRTIDKILSDALSEADSSGVANDGNDNLVRLELDMILSKDQYYALYGKSRNGRHKRKAIRSEWYRWPENEVPYQITPEVFDAGDLKLIMGAMKEWERLTCLTFRDKEFWDSDYVYFDNTWGCSSRVGKVGGRQLLSLASGCRHHGVIVHEIGHAIGFFHEHSRPDRDDYVRVNWENIEEDAEGNFNKSLLRAVNTYDVPYDINSVMHYGKKYFSVDDVSLTIETINPEDQDVIGNRRGLSFHDVQLANRMYQCNASCPTPNPCPSDAYRGKDCKCYCNSSSAYSPVKECEDTVVTPPKAECRDISKTCQNAYDLEENCRIFPSYKKNCKKSCNLCEDKLVTPPKAECIDKNKNCKNVYDLDGYCRKLPSFRENCKKSCNLCEDKVVTPPKAECVDISGTCEITFITFNNADHLCKTSPFKENCKKFCNLC